VVTLAGSKLVKLIKWVVADDGTITRAAGDRTLEYQAAHLAAASNLVTAAQLYPFSTLRVANWTNLK
jgi:hypothetical protein